MKQVDRGEASPSILFIMIVIDAAVVCLTPVVSDAPLVQRGSHPQEVRGDAVMRTRAPVDPSTMRRPVTDRSLLLQLPQLIPPINKKKKKGEDRDY